MAGRYIKLATFSSFLINANMSDIRTICEMFISFARDACGEHKNFIWEETNEKRKQQNKVFSGSDFSWLRLWLYVQSGVYEVYLL